MVGWLAYKNFGYLPHRQLRKNMNVSTNQHSCYLPHRQLRNY